MTMEKRFIKVFLATMVLFLAVFQFTLTLAQGSPESESKAFSQTQQSNESYTADYDAGASNNYTVGQNSLNNAWQWFVNRYQIASLKVKILVVIVIYLLISLFFLFLFIMVNRTIKTKQRRHAQKMKELYQVELTDYLFGEENQSFGFTGIKNNTNREIFINELLSLHNNLYGEAASRLRDLFFNLELYKDSLNKTHNRRWNIKAKGIGELAQMDVKDANNEIVKYANYKNQILRMEAQVALVKLNDSDPLFFLDDLKYELSEWEQINILNTLMHYQINIESFERWMSSKNNTVVVFAVKMAGLFKHIQSWPKVLELLEHEDPKVRLAAIKTLDMFEVAENAGPFKTIYEKEQAIEEKEDDVFYNLNMNRNRLAAMNALETVVTPNDIEFIEKVLATEKDFKIQQRVVNLILKSIPNGQAIIDRAYVNADLQLKKIIDHAKQTVEQ